MPGAHDVQYISRLFGYGILFTPFLVAMGWSTYYTTLKNEDYQKELMIDDISAVSVALCTRNS